MASLFYSETSDTQPIFVPVAAARWADPTRCARPRSWEWRRCRSGPRRRARDCSPSRSRGAPGDLSDPKEGAILRIVRQSRRGGRPGGECGSLDRVWWVFVLRLFFLHVRAVPRHPRRQTGRHDGGCVRHGTCPVCVVHFTVRSCQSLLKCTVINMNQLVNSISVAWSSMAMWQILA